MKFLALMALTLGTVMARAEAVDLSILDDQSAQAQVGDESTLADPTIVDEDGNMQPDRVRPRVLSCYARDVFRVTYRASARGYYASARQVQRAAVRFCRSESYIPRTCKALGCRWER